MVFRHLGGPLQGTILDQTYTNAAALYEAPEPTWSRRRSSNGAASDDPRYFRPDAMAAR